VLRSKFWNPSSLNDLDMPACAFFSSLSAIEGWKNKPRAEDLSHEGIGVTG
jgi:hypothetical protein